MMVRGLEKEQALCRCELALCKQDRCCRMRRQGQFQLMGRRDQRIHAVCQQELRIKGHRKQDALQDRYRQGRENASHAEEMIQG